MKPESGAVSLVERVQYRAVVILIYVGAVILALSLLAVEWHKIDGYAESVALERGRAMFRLIEITRDWNAAHGGVYVPVDQHNPPNPYLQHPRRDITTTDGQALTLINPAYMTRQIAELAAANSGIRFNITSLKPIRPANEADPWEAESLGMFGEGVKERVAFIPGANPMHRYMAPLYVKKTCLGCHGEAGYKVGDVRGGISVTMPAANLLEIRRNQRASSAASMLGGVMAAALLLHLIAYQARKHLQRLRTVLAGREATIAERTRDLATANVSLRQEMERREADRLELAESEQRYRSVVEHGQDGILVVERRHVVFANQRMGDMLGMDVEEIIGRDLLDLLEQPDRPLVAERYERRMNGEAVPNQYRVRLAHAGAGATVVVDFWVTRLAPAEAQRVLINVHDVTPKLAMERELKIAAAVFDNAAVAVVVTDPEGIIVRVNPAFTAITGYTPREALGRTPRLLKSGRHDLAFYRAMWDAFKGEGRWEGEIWNRRKNGELYVEWLSVTRVQNVDGVGGFVATFTDITQRKEAEEAIRHRAHHDPLTDLPNRALFYDLLEGAAASAARYERRFGLMFVDLDYFKDVNDQHGHAAGDELLVETARRLLGCVRHSDTVARMGGDEFAIILAELEHQQVAEEVARRVLQQLSSDFVLKCGVVRISCSVGLALYPEHDRDLDALQRKADQALYAAKDAGRNAYRVYAAAGGEAQGDLPL